MTPDAVEVTRAFAAHDLSVPADDLDAISAAVPGVRALGEQMRTMPSWSAAHQFDAPAARTVDRQVRR
jgi:hypothetical protein